MTEKHALLKRFERFRKDPYIDSAGYPTIGYGSRFYPNGKEVKMTDASISEMFASSMLGNHMLKEVRPIIDKYVKTPLNENQKEALESFVYNLGWAAFRNSDGSKTGLAKCLDFDDFEGAGEEFLKWNKITRNGKKIALKGLTQRREQERRLFLTRPHTEFELKEEEEKTTIQRSSSYDRICNWLRAFFNQLKGKNDEW